MTGERHIVVADEPPNRVVAMDSITHANAEHGPGDVLVGGSFGGIVAVQFAARYRPKGVIVHDCGIGKEGAGISGLWYLDGAGVPAAAIDTGSARIADGVDMWRRGRISVVNHWADGLGVRPGMTVPESARLLFGWDDRSRRDDAPRERRTVVATVGERAVVAADSIRFALPEDRDNVICVGSHGGRTAAHYALEIGPAGFISSDGGVGRDRSGVSGLDMLAAEDIPAAAVSVATARIGEGGSTYHDGVLSVVNDPASRLGIRVGDPAREAAQVMAAHNAPAGDA